MTERSRPTVRPGRRARSARGADAPLPEPPALAAARSGGDAETLLTALVQAADDTPLFPHTAPTVLDWIAEAAHLAERVLSADDTDARLRLRRAEAFLAVGALDAGLMAARDAAGQAEGGLRERALLVAHRCLTRLGRHDEARAVFAGLVAGDAREDDAWVPGLALLAQGEALLAEGAATRAVGLFERAVAWLPDVPGAARLRVDALLGLALLDHLAGALDDARLRLRAAAELAEAAGARSEAAACAFLAAVTTANRPQSGALEAVVQTANALLELPSPPPRDADAPVDRLTRLVGTVTREALHERVVELARSAGDTGDLAAYVLWCRAAGALDAVEGRADAAEALLEGVAQSLDAQGLAAAAGALRAR